jgi:hypothetical protein
MQSVLHHLGTSISEVVASVEEVQNSVEGNEDGRLTKDERKWARIGTLVAVVVFWLIATCLQPWNLFDKGPYTTDFYDVQARALVHGRLDVPANVAGIEGFEIDGKTQIYFGIGPAIMRLPFSGVSDVFDRRLSLLSELLALSVLGLAAARLLKKAKSLVLRAPDGRPWWFAAFAASATLGTPLLFFASSPLVYHEAELWGAAAGLAGLDLVLRWWREPTSRHLIEAVLLATFAVSCRPSSGLSPAIALGIFGLALLWRHRWKKALVVLVASVIPLIAFAIANWARFGSLFSVPFPLQVFSQFNENRQAMLRDNNGSFFGLKFAPTNLIRYFSPTAISFERLFPFVDWPAKATVYGNVTFDTVDRSGSIITGAPMFIPFALVGAWWTLVQDRTRQWSVISLAAVVSTFSTITIAYVAHRYLADLVPALLVLACAGIWCIARSLQMRPKWLKRSALGVLALLFAIGFWNQLGLAVTTRAFSILPTEIGARAMVALQYSLDDFLFGGAPPNVLRISDGPLPTGDAVPAGTIAIVGDCSAAYRYDGYGWGPLDRKLGEGHSFKLTGAIGAEWTTVVSADYWTLSAKRTEAGVIFVRSDFDSVASEPVDLPTDVVTLDVTVDPNPIGVISVSFNGSEIFYSFAGDAIDVVPGTTWLSDQAPAAFCESLLKRFGS